MGLVPAWVPAPTDGSHLTFFYGWKMAIAHRFANAKQGRIGESVNDQDLHQ